MTKYKDTMNQEAVYFLALPDRYTLFELAEHLGINHKTLVDYRIRYPEFGAAVKKGLELRKLRTVKDVTNYVRKYKPAYAKQMMLLMAEGDSQTSVSAKFGITDETFGQWKTKYPEFLEAFKLGQLLHQQWWEDTGRDGMMGRISGFNSSIWALNMKNRFKYSEKTELSGDQDKPIAQKIIIEVVGVDEDLNENS